MIANDEKKTGANRRTGDVEAGRERLLHGRQVMRHPLEAQLLTRLSAIEAELAHFVPRVILHEGAKTWDHPGSQGLLYRAFGYSPEHLEIHQITTKAHLLLIGNAGSGKSYILKKAYTLAVRRFISAHTDSVPLYYELNRVARHYGIEGSLKRTFEHIFVPEEQERTYALFLDELDKQLISEPNPRDFVNELYYFLQDYRHVIDSVVIACRRPFYYPSWFDECWQVYHSDTLRYEDYAHIIPNEDLLREFYRRTQSLGIRKLLDIPIIGFDLAYRFAAGKDLPSTRQQWFERKMMELLGVDTQPPSSSGASSRTRRRFLAEQLACLSLFGGHAPWAETEALDQIGESSTVGDTVTLDDVQQLLRTPLFTKSGDRFDFTHQLFAEYLAANALQELPLRKQRQLLTTENVALRGRVKMPYRGVAVFLAEISPVFGNYLLKSDPLILFLAELPVASFDLNDHLLRAVMDEAIAKHRAPWWHIPPRGEVPIDYMRKHMPTDLQALFAPYLESDNEFALLWATRFVAELGGHVRLNPAMIRIAHNAHLNQEIRKGAIAAVSATGKVASIRRLYDLKDSENDEIRGHTIRAYRITESPKPSQMIPVFIGGRRQANLIGSLHHEVYTYVRGLGADQLRQAFDVMLEQYERLGDMRGVLFRSLLERAKDQEFYAFPAEVVIWPLLEIRRSIDYKETLVDLVRSDDGLWSRVWRYVFCELGAVPPRPSWLLVDKFLGKTCSDVIFELLPETSASITRDQESLIQSVLAYHFYREPTPERLQQFQRRAPEYTSDLRMPKLKPPDLPEDPLKLRGEIGEILNSKASAVEKATALLGLMSQYHNGKARNLPELQEMVKFTEQLFLPLRQRVLATFRECVESTSYSRSYSEPGRFSVTQPVFSAPFWILRRMGFAFPVEKIEEIVAAYAFLGGPPFNVATAQEYTELVEELRERAPDRWQHCICSFLDPEADLLSSVLRYLGEKELDMCLDLCRQRLAKCDFAADQFDALLDYWLAFKPDEYADVLIRCYEGTGHENIRRAILYELLQDDIDWAWSELSRLIADGDAPEAAPISTVRSMRLPANPERLPMVADWYAQLRRKAAERVTESHGGFSQVDPMDDMIRLLNETMIGIGGEEAIRELQRLQSVKAFPDSDWLSYAILRVEDDMLTRTASEGLAAGSLLDFINRDRFGVVNCDRDLFEWVCQAIEDEKHDLEGPGEGVQAYWDDSEPKPETGCQNIFWHALRLRLHHLGITGVEERQIRKDRVDLWVEKLEKGHESLRVAVETKVARKSYGPAKLVRPLKTQLWEQYLEPTGVTHGIYVVFWYRDPERYPYPAKWNTPDELLDALEATELEVEDAHRVELACYVIDVTTPSRKH